MLKVRDGDVGKLGILYERHHGMLLNFFVRMTGDRHLSQDLVQDVFFRILKYRNTYREQSNFVTWMYRIARHVRFDDLRKKQREVLMDESEIDQPQTGPGPVEKLEKLQEIRMLRGALQRLAPEKREVLVLSRFQLLKYEEIGEILGCEVGAVKVRVYRAIRELRDTFFQLAGEKAS
jgi:RNA polymerase sigma-70 factor (ECF subfamily)